MQKEMKTNLGKLLLDSEPLIIIPELAVKVGLNESIILQQIHYWLEINKKVGRNHLENRFWTYNKYEDWKKQFPFWSVSTIKRAIYNLENQNLLTSTDKFNKMKIDKTKWYSINYDILENLEKSTVPSTCQNELSVDKSNDVSNCDIAKRDVQRVNLNRTIPETTTEINLEEEEVMQAYKKVKNRYLNSEEKKKLRELMQNHSITLILKAIDIMVTDAEKITLKYIASTLEDWKTKDIQTVEEVDKMRAEWQESKNKKQVKKPAVKSKKVSTFNDYKQREYNFNDLEKKLVDEEEVLKEADCSKCILWRNGKCFLNKSLVSGKCSNYSEKKIC
jgi:DnaD/phage-associated family protein